MGFESNVGVTPKSQRDDSKKQGRDDEWDGREIRVLEPDSFAQVGVYGSRRSESDET